MKTRLDDLLYRIKISTDLSSILSQSTRLTERQTDGQTEFSSLDRVCISCSTIKMGRVDLDVTYKLRLIVKSLQMVERKQSKSPALEMCLSWSF